MEISLGGISKINLVLGHVWRFSRAAAPRRKPNIIKYSSQTNIFSLSAHELFHSLPWWRRYVDIKMQLDGRFLKAPSNFSANSQSAFLIRLRAARDLSIFFVIPRIRELKSDVLKAPIQEIVCLFVLMLGVRGEGKLCFQLLGYYANQFSFRLLCADWVTTRERTKFFSIYSNSKKRRGGEAHAFIRALPPPFTWNFCSRKSLELE